MEVFFDSPNILDANIRSKHDNSILYTLHTSSSVCGPQVTVLTDVNPAFAPSPTKNRLAQTGVAVGAIHWSERVFELQEQRKPISDLKTREGGWFSRSRYWRWQPERRKYRVRFDHDKWRATLNPSAWCPSAAHFEVPYAPSLFSKSLPSKLKLTRTAILEDEIFLILLLIYSEIKRQDRMNGSWGSLGGAL